MASNKLSQFAFGHNVVSIANNALKEHFKARIHPKDVNKIIVVNEKTKKAVVIEPVIEDRGVDINVFGSQLIEAVKKLL
jgi:hypothetical protein